MRGYATSGPRTKKPKSLEKPRLCKSTAALSKEVQYPVLCVLTSLTSNKLLPVPLSDSIEMFPLESQELVTVSTTFRSNP